MIDRSGFQAFQAWLFDEALPLWSTNAVDPAGGFFERLSPEGVPADDPRRARVVARQIYVFARAEALGWPADPRRLVRHGLAQLLGGMMSTDQTVIPLLSPAGEVLETRLDLYDQAFTLFCLAAAGAIGEDSANLERRAVMLRQRMLEGWKHPLAGFEEASPRSLPLKANPHMHLFEAALAWEDAGGDQAWSELADEIAGLCLQRFRSPRTGAVHEYFDGDWTRIPTAPLDVVEPGHQFEWAWLLIRWGRARGRADAIVAARELFDIAETHGVHAVSGLAMSELNADLSVRSDMSRLWPQTERLKAAIAMRSIVTDSDEAAHADDIIAKSVNGLLRYFDHPLRGAWWENITAAGVPLREQSRTSSLYHIVCAFDELHRHVQLGEVRQLA